MGTDGIHAVSTDAPLRPWALPADALERAHIQPWNDAAGARFTNRVALLMRRGVADTDDLAERLHLRDLELNERRTYGEFAHLLGHALAGWRCRVPRAACRVPRAACIEHGAGADAWGAG